MLKRFSQFSFLGVLLGYTIAQNVVFAQSELPVFQTASLPSNHVYEYELDAYELSEYEAAVENLLGIYENANGVEFRPSAKGKVALKVYSDSGPGLSTPEALVEAVVRSLTRRGYERSDIFILGLSARHLRLSGFLPPLSHRSDYFNQVFVRSLDTGMYYDERWFYDSPLPAQSAEYWVDIEEENSIIKPMDETAARRSLLPMPLMHEVDFWINLPCYSDHPTLGVNGALMNATLWNASNTLRFLKSPATAPVAVAEMGAIPELRETWAFNIASLERYQFVGGPIFNSLYTVGEARVLLSDNPVLLDSLMRERINYHRLKNGFAPLPQDLKILAYSEQLGLGDRDTEMARLIEVN